MKTQTVLPVGEVNAFSLGERSKSLSAAILLCSPSEKWIGDEAMAAKDPECFVTKLWMVKRCVCAQRMDVCVSTFMLWACVWEF